MEELGGCHNNIGARWSDKLPVVDLDCGGAESQPTGHDAAQVSHCGREGCQFILGTSYIFCHRYIEHL